MGWTRTSIPSEGTREYHLRSVVGVGALKPRSEPQVSDHADSAADETWRTGAFAGRTRAPNGSGRIRRRGELAYDHIKRQLLTGRFALSGILPVENIAAELEISRQPVMEAMKRLASEGFIDIIPQVGCRPVRADPECVGDHFRLFAATEGLLAELAADRWRGRELAVVQDVSATIRSELNRTAKVDKTVNRYRMLNRQLHEGIHAMARAKPIAEIARRLADLADFYIATMTPNLLQPLRAELAQDEHEAVVELIGQREAARAGQAMSEHIQHFGRHVRDGMEKGG